jgi:hypothetical protein
VFLCFYFISFRPNIIGNFIATTRKIRRIRERKWTRALVVLVDGIRLDQDSLRFTPQTMDPWLARDNPGLHWRLTGSMTIYRTVPLMCSGLFEQSVNIGKARSKAHTCWGVVISASQKCNIHSLNYVMKVCFDVSNKWKHICLVMFSTYFIWFCSNFIKFRRFSPLPARDAKTDDTFFDHLHITLQTRPQSYIKLQLYN